ncbi:MAG: GatB/YqeY domain-containing protein [Candidatus Thermochlorobacter sp.]
MTLKERINEDLKAAMKAGDKIRLEAVRAIKKDIIEKETAEKRAQRGDLTPEEELEVLTAMVKRRRDSIEQFKQAGRNDLADEEIKQLAVIEQYLPAQLSEAEVKEVVQKIILQVGATSAKDIGKVMGAAMKELKGKADGSLVQKIAKDLLPN